jgi:hypothetical protein
VDDGATYSDAIFRAIEEEWKFEWTPSAVGPVTIKSRTRDTRFGIVQDPPTEGHVTVRSPITIRAPSDQPTIQAAIDVADIGDTVLVAPGTYAENINFRGKAITVTSESSPKDTIIEGLNASSVAVFNSGEGRNSVLNGFTLQKGGGGITVEGASPTITNNVITSNRSCKGGGVRIASGSPLIRLNTITSNGSQDFCSGSVGAGISIEGASSVEILDNVISNNTILPISPGTPFDGGGGIYIFATGVQRIKGNIIKGNSASGEKGGGIFIFNSPDALIVQNLITDNQADVGGGIYWLMPSGARGPILVNNTIADNNAISNGSGIFADGNDARILMNNIIVAKPGQTGLHCGDFVQDRPIIRFNNIFSDGGMAYGGNCLDMTGSEGNISLDPLFANPTQGDYHLQQGSPSIDSGNNLTPNLPDKDLDEDPRILDGDGNGTAIVDMGVDEFLAPPGFGISLQLDRRSRMRRESHVGFFEGVGVRFPRATRSFVGGITAGYQFTGRANK